MSYHIYLTETFSKDYDSLSNSERNRIDKILNQIEINPYSGKPLGYKFFREKKFDGKRLYYLIYDEWVVAFVIAMSDKKTQQSTINSIKNAFDLYREEISRKLGK